MTFTPKSLKEKPYVACVNCSYLGKTCDGPNFLSMSSEQWSEWAKLRKDFLGWTNQDVIVKSGVSKATVERAFAGSIDLRLSNMQAITKALINGTWGQYPCAMHSDNHDSTDVTASLARAEELLEVEQRKVAFLREQVAINEHQMLEKDRQIESKDERLAERRDFIYRKDRVIWILSVLLGIAVLIIISGLVIDAMNPYKGFFWLSRVLRTGHNVAYIFNQL